MIQAALTPPQELSLPFASWTLDRLVAYLSEEKGVRMRRSRVAEVLSREGRVNPEFAAKTGSSSASTHPRQATAS